VLSSFGCDLLEKMASVDQHRHSNPVMLTSDDKKDSDEKSKSFIVMYLGSATLDRRYPPQFVMPWVMAEVKRRKGSFKEIRLDVMPHVLQATVCLENSRLFDHTLTSLSRFAKTHQDPRCFAYLMRLNLYCDFECHVFLAHNEQMVSMSEKEMYIQ